MLLRQKEHQLQRLPGCRWRRVSVGVLVLAGAPLQPDPPWLTLIYLSGWPSRWFQWRHWRWRGRLDLSGWLWVWGWCAWGGKFLSPSYWHGCCRGCRRSCCERDWTGYWPLTSGPAGLGSCPGLTRCCSGLWQRCKVWMWFWAAQAEGRPFYRWLYTSKLKPERQELININ